MFNVNEWGCNSFLTSSDVAAMSSLVPMVSVASVPHLRTDPTRLPELDETPIEVHPLAVARFSEVFSQAARVGNGIGVFGSVDGDLVEISMSGCDGLKRQGYPCGGQNFDPKYHFFQF